MELICKHCRHVSKSFILEKEYALAEIMLDFSKHMTQSHNGRGDRTPFKLWMQDCALITQTVPTIVLIAKHSTLLDRDLDVDDFIQEKFSLLVDQLQDFLGIEVFDNKPNELGEGKVNLESLEPSKLDNVIPVSEEEMKNYPGTDLSLPQME